jgi:hypothetical protein
MKTLIISTNREKSPEIALPIGACAVATAADMAGHDVHFLDLCFARSPAACAEEAAHKLRPDAVGLSIRNLDNCDYTSPHSYLPEIKSIVDACRRGCGAEIVIGGPAVSQSPEAMARHIGCRIAVSGEGEESYPALLRSMARGEDCARVPGVTVVDGDETRSTPHVPARDVSSLPDPEPWRWLDLRRYRSHGAAMPLQAKRGCALRCSYCVYPLLEGSAWRVREPEMVADDVVNAREAGMDAVEFVDSVFGLPAKHALECCEAVARREPGIPLSTLGLNPLACTDELIDTMNDAGFSAVGITAESGSDTMLESLRKNFTSEDLHRTVEKLALLNARKLWMFMIGGPGETEATVARTARFIEGLPSSDLALITHGVRVLPGTPLCDDLISEGIISPDDELIHPTFYYSPQVSETRAMEIIGRCSFPSANMVTLTDCGHRLAPTVQRLASLLGARPPYWRGLPLINQARRVLRV